MSVAVLEEEGQRGASQRHDQVRRRAGIFFAQEIRRALLVSRVGPRQVEKIGIDLDFSRRAFEQPLARRLADLGGGRKRVVEGVQHENAPRRLLRAGA